MNRKENARPAPAYDGYSIAARVKDDEAQVFAKKIRISKRLEGCAIVAMALLDLALFYEPVTVVLYNTSPLLVGFLCIASAAGPIVLAWATALLVRGHQHRGEERWHAPLAALAGTFTIALLVFAWQVRAAYWADDTGVGLFLNVLAASLSVIAFIVDYVLGEARMRHMLLRDVALAERDALEHMDFEREFAGIDKSDLARRSANDAAYLIACRRSVEEAVDACLLFRELLAQNKATSAEAYEHILSTPLKFGDEELEASSRTELIDEIYERVKGPVPEETKEEWGPQSNTSYVSRKWAGKLAEHDALLKRLREGSTENGDKSDSAKPRPGSPMNSGGADADMPIPIEAQVIG